MSTVREARLMNVREYRVDAGTHDEKVIVMSRGVIRGSWTPGVEGIDSETLASVMGLTGILEAIKVRDVLAQRREAAEDARDGFHPVPKPSAKKARR